MDGLQTFDYDSVIQGTFTPGDNVYAEQKVTIPFVDGRTPCLTRVEAEVTGSDTAADEDIVSLSSATTTTTPRKLSDPTVVALLKSGKKSGAVTAPNQSILVYDPVCPIPLTKIDYWLGALLQNANAIHFCIHVTYRKIQGSAPQVQSAMRYNR